MHSETHTQTETHRILKAQILSTALRYSFILGISHWKTGQSVWVSLCSIAIIFIFNIKNYTFKMPKLKVQNIQQNSMLYYVASLAILAMICAGRHPKFAIYQPERKNKRAKLPGWQRSAWEITKALRTEPLLFSTDRSQLKRFKYLVGITLSYLVMQKSFIDIISKMAVGKTRNYSWNSVSKSLVHLLEKMFMTWLSLSKVSVWLTHFYYIYTFIHLYTSYLIRNLKIC